MPLFYVRKKYSFEIAFSQVYNSHMLIKPIVEAYDFLGGNMACVCSSQLDRKYLFDYQVLNECFFHSFFCFKIFL